MVPHGLKHLRVTSNWADGEELQTAAPRTSETNPADKDWWPFSGARRTTYAASLKPLADISHSIATASAIDSKAFTAADHANLLN